MTDIARVPSGQSLGAPRLAGPHTRRPAGSGTSPGLAAPQHSLPSAPRAHVGESIADLKARLDLPGIVAGHVTLKRRGRHEHWGRCPFHADRTPSFKVDTHTGRYHCFGCGAGGDVLDFLAAVEGLDSIGAIKRARELAGGTVERRTPPLLPATAIVPDREAQHEGLSPHGWRLWRARREITPDCPAGRHFAARGCPLPPNDVGWSPDQLHPSGYAGPAILALVTDVVTGEPLNLHRTRQTPDGGDKAPVDKPRLVLKGHRLRRGVVRLWADEEVTTGLCVAEGLETGLSAALAYGLCWTTINAGNLGGLPVLPGVEALTIVADHDDAGIRAAEACARRWTEAGAEVRVWRSGKPGTDFNDRVRGAAA